MNRIVILASGSGSNAENIIKYFNNNESISVTQVLTNKKDAKVLERAKRLNISSGIFNREEFSKSNVVLDILKKKADYIILAGFLWKIPETIIEAFPNKIINIHPALLPKYGGKGMYGMHVHDAVVENKEKESGITIHFVNENYDEGAIVFQKKFEVLPSDSAEDVANKVHTLEYENFPKVIEQVILKNG
ncbi:phosphoribosylglycinamide formyltransferase [Lutibacter citreus]|uniref:phosphoribosylglycinamide formyltransferase n=1 Tax=Lutibacter citreus TaxID=2138210 RepID=UPI000DBE0E9B|nr:phosphoribosylglycinamide formyltransferase [Lutibacter citreus]